MGTKNKIMDVALQMFAEKGYTAVSIRDICGEVGIKESTLYYHFINKQDILDTLLAKFEDHIAGLLEHAEISGAIPNNFGNAEMPGTIPNNLGNAKIPGTKQNNLENAEIPCAMPNNFRNTKMPGATPDSEEPDNKQTMDFYMMDSYLFDPFCNLMLRFMMIEQFHNEKIRQVYEKYLFTKPYEIQKSIFDMLALGGIMTKEDADWLLDVYFSFMTMLTYKYLLNGELTDERKSAYSKEVHDFYDRVVKKCCKKI